MLVEAADWTGPVVHTRMRATAPVLGTRPPQGVFVQETPQRPRVASSVLLALLVAACSSDGPSDPIRNEPGIRIVSGASLADTIDTQPLQALVVEVRRPDGDFARGVVVRFEARPPADTARRFDAAVFVCVLSAPTCGPPFGLAAFASDTTDAQGRAKALVRLGRVAGRAFVRVVVPEFGMSDSATFTVTPGAAVGVRAAAGDTALDIGATATLRGRVVDRYNNTRPEVPVLAAGFGSAFTVDATTGIVTGRAMGAQWLFARHASFTDSTNVRVVPIGRLVVWTSGARAVRLVNLNGSGTRQIISSVSSDLGAFPRFDATRSRVSMHAGSNFFGGTPNNVIVVDTTGAPRRDIGPDVGFSAIIAVRQLADGTVLVVGRRTAAGPFAVYALWRVASDNTITSAAALPSFFPDYGGADISHDGSRVAYIATTASFSTELRVLTVADGAITVLEARGRSPRWSSQGDRVAYLVQTSGSFSGNDGAAVVINADGTGRRALGSFIFSPGLAWSPDGTYLVGRNSSFAVATGLRVLRVSDGADVLLHFRSPAGNVEDYFQPDWR